jgi:hypothetical protein
MRTLEFIYQETKIHFLINPSDNNVMVNATEMAKMFDKRVDVFLKTDHVKAFMSVLEFTPYGGNSEGLTRADLVQTKGHMGTYMHRLLALKFAAWLDPAFEVWVYTTIDTIVFGNYKKHWEAHMAQEDARKQMEILKKALLTAPTQDLAIRYFEQEGFYLSAKNAKRAAIANQMKMDL